jgi:hypothetical protein
MPRRRTRTGPSLTGCAAGGGETDVCGRNGRLHLEDGEVVFRTKLQLSFKYESPE